MANAWGELSWNTGTWGDQNNVSVTLTAQTARIMRSNRFGFNH
jgi:hypothetical protein